MKIRVESSHKADEVPGRPEKVQPHRREIRSYSKVYGQLVSVREGKPCWTGSGLPLHVVTDRRCHSPTANLGIRQFREKTARRAPCGMVGKTTHGLVTTFYTYLHPTPVKIAQQRLDGLGAIRQ
jgi:hypothetical protein